MRSSSSRRASSPSRPARTVLLQLKQDIAAAGEIAHQHALAVTYDLRADVFVSGGILEYRADVHAALVGEGALADERLGVGKRQVRQFRDEAARG